MHIVEGIVDLIQRLAMGDELVDLELAIHVVLNKSRQLSTAFDASESAPTPDSLLVIQGQLSVLCVLRTRLE